MNIGLQSDKTASPYDSNSCFCCYHQSHPIALYSRICFKLLSDTGPHIHETHKLVSSKCSSQTCEVHCSAALYGLHHIGVSSLQNTCQLWIWGNKFVWKYTFRQLGPEIIYNTSIQDLFPHDLLCYACGAAIIFMNYDWGSIRLTFWSRIYFSLICVIQPVIEPERISLY